MGKVEREGDLATCGHENTGSTNVYINGRGATRTEIDTAGGTITGPGVASVLVNGYPISIEGDIVTPHGLFPHNSSKTANPSEDVFAG